MPPRLAPLSRDLQHFLRLSLRTFSTRSPRQSSSVSASEISHFTTLASSWWDPSGPSALLHAMNPLRHVFISRCRGAAPPPARYLDVGCGGGIFAESAARLPATRGVVGVDPTPEVLAVARAHLRADPPLAGSGKLVYREGGVETLPLPAAEGEGAVDVVSVFEVVEHVNRPAEFLEACMRHVRPGGWLVGSTIARTWTSWVTTKVVAEDVLGLVPRGTHDWNKYIQPDEMRAWAAKQKGWGEWRVMGVVYVPGLGWREVKGSEGWGNYFFALRRDD